MSNSININYHRLPITIFRAEDFISIPFWNFKLFFTKWAIFYGHNNRINVDRLAVGAINILFLFHSSFLLPPSWKPSGKLCGALCLKLKRTNCLMEKTAYKINKTFVLVHEVALPGISSTSMIKDKMGQLMPKRLAYLFF